MNQPQPVNPEVADAISQLLCHRVRDLRQQNGWSLDQLGTASGVSRSMLSQIERNEANPTLAVTARIAQAFGLTIGELVEAPRKSTGIHVIRGDDPAHLYRSDEDCEIRTLSPLPLEKDVEFYQLKLKPGRSLKSDAHFQKTREFITVEQGKIRITSSGETRDLAKGDSASYRADVPHSIENRGKGEALTFLVVIYE
ncbi:MAG: XRE family transcriptional regulator [Planctomyces sp.]|nr:XRE family transcriptional regulator [Planctomyces sp.]